MLLPNNFENEISSRFYDKEVTVLETRERIESDGGVVREDNAEKCKFFGNVRFNAQEELKSDIGLHLDADITITCRNETNVSLNDIVVYLGKRYKVNNLIPSDSHLTITGKECK